MAGPRNSQRRNTQASRLASTPGLAKGGRKEAPRRSTRTMQDDSASSDEEEDSASSADSADHDMNDDNDVDDNDDDNESDEEEDAAALSRSYPFEFDNDGSVTGTDDEMDISASQMLAADNEFVKSMRLADYHATAASHDSDADDYTALDQVNDDDEDETEMPDADLESNVLREAEKDLIAEFEQSEHQSALYAVDAQLTPRSARKVSFDESEHDSAADVPSGVNMNEDPFQGAAFMDDTWGSLWENAELGIWRKPLQEGDVNEQARNPRQKRVRFQEHAALARVSSNEESSSSSDDDDAEQFPDIFVEQNDPKIRHLLDESEAEWNGLGGNGSDLESVYDFEDDADRFAFELDEDSASSEADVSSESDDDGDDTEDETVEEQHAKMQQFRKAMRQVASTSTPSTPRVDRPNTASSQESVKTPASRRTVSPRQGRGPRQGTFVCDPTKAILTTDKSTRKTILYPPAQPSAQHKAFWDRARSAVQATHGSPRGTIAIPASQRHESPERPFTAKATLGSMFDGRIDIFDEASSLPPPTNTQSTSPFPSFSPSVMSSFTAGDDGGSDMDAEYPAAFNTMLNMDKFDDSSSDTDMNAPGPRTGEPAFLAHGVVGSFRLNQHRARLESSLPSNPAKRASAAEHNALQNGRRAAGNAPITPARKRRSNSQDLFRTGSGVKKNTALAFSSPSLARRRHSRGQSLSGRLDQTLTPEMWKRM